jgi:membrane peptidoglycan carboxypeptidase
MQLVRNVLFDEEERVNQSYLRKIREALLAVQLASRYPKNDILEMYLNEVFYGNHAYGAPAAALSYFGKEAKDLTLAEAALLAGLPQSPTSYNPYVNADFAVRRQHYVLDQMVKYNFITQERADEAKQQPLYLSGVKTRFEEAPHFAQYVRDLLIQRFGYEKVYYGGLRVVTSIDLNLQKIATEKAREHITRLRRSNANNSAVVSIDPKTGEVLAMVGSVDFRDERIDGQVNIATALRQPGSSIKPFTYVTAFQRYNYLPATMINDVVTSFPQKPGLPDYRPQNFNFKEHGWVPIREALGNSMNVPPVKLLAQVGVPSMIDTAHKMGIRSLDRPAEQYGLAITLGAAEVRPLDITFAYSVFANGGKLVGAAVPPERQKEGYATYEPVVIKAVYDYKGDVLYEHKPQPPIQVIPPEYAYLVTSILSDDTARRETYGPHSFLELSRPAAAKTGTTEYRQDGWTIGYTPDLVTGVWTGNADNSPMIDVAGVSGAGVIWHNIMEEALRDRPPQHFVVPPKIREGDVCGRIDIYIEGKPIICSAG